MNLQPLSEWSETGSNLIFIFSPERAGSTMLQLMLESHSRIYGLPEPNLLPPLKYLGYFDVAPFGAAYEPINQSLGVREFIGHLPGKEADYITACRAYANTLYRKVISGHESAYYFVDKTPANVLVWDMIVQLYPAAKYIVLRRHPYALIDSCARSFYLNDYAKMAAENTRLVEHIRAVVEFLEESPVAKLTTSFETLTEHAEEEAKRILQFLELEMEPTVVNYGNRPHETGAMGDPITAAGQTRPQERRAWQWAGNFASKPGHKAIADKMLAKISDGEMAIYGYPRAEWMKPVQAWLQKERPAVQRLENPSYQWQRKIYFILRGIVKKCIPRKWLVTLRYYCDVLLRP